MISLFLGVILLVLPMSTVDAVTINPCTDQRPRYVGCPFQAVGRNRPAWATYKIRYYYDTNSSAGCLPYQFFFIASTPYSCMTGGANSFESDAACRSSCMLPMTPAPNTVTPQGIAGCPPGLPAVQCYLDPCRANKCPAYPTATCQSDYCGACNARFYVNGRQVNCRSGTPQTTTPKGTAGCPPGVPAVQCYVDPCRASRCPAYPTATCQSDYCGACNARFYVNGNKVDCGSVPSSQS